jgi:hypothetical protein
MTGPVMKNKISKRNRRPGLSWKAFFPILVFMGMAAGPCLPALAGKIVIDDFNQTGLDTGEWTIFSSPGGLFSQPGDGQLHFDPLIGVFATGSAKLTSKAAVGQGFFSIEFQDFTSTNLQPPGSHQGAFIGLGLTDGTNWVRIIRDQNGINGQPYGVFEVNYNIGAEIQVHFVETAVTRGKLGLRYDGRKVTFHFDDGNGWRSTGWRTSGQSGEWIGEWTPGWTANPRIYLQGYDLFGKTSARLDNLIFSGSYFLYLPLIYDRG